MTMPVMPLNLMPIRSSVTEGWHWQSEELPGLGAISEVHERLSAPVFRGSYRFERRPDVLQPLMDLWEDVRGPALPWWLWTYLRRGYRRVWSGEGDGAEQVFAVPLRDFEAGDAVVYVDGSALGAHEWEMGDGLGGTHDSVGRTFIKLTGAPGVDEPVEVTVTSARRLVPVRFAHDPLVVSHPGYRRYAMEVSVKQAEPV